MPSCDDDIDSSELGMPVNAHSAPLPSALMRKYRLLVVPPVPVIAGSVPLGVSLKSLYEPEVATVARLAVVAYPLSVAVVAYGDSAVEIAVFIAVVLLYELSAVEIAVFIVVVLLYELSAVEIAVFIVVVLLYELKSTVGDAKVPSFRR